MQTPPNNNNQNSGYEQRGFTAVPAGGQQPGAGQPYYAPPQPQAPVQQQVGPARPRPMRSLFSPRGNPIPRRDSPIPRRDRRIRPSRRSLIPRSRGSPIPPQPGQPPVPQQPNEYYQSAYQPQQPDPFPQRQQPITRPGAAAMAGSIWFWARSSAC